MRQKVEIRPMEAGDAAAVAAFSSLFPDGWDEKALRESLTLPHYRIFTALLDGEPRAFCAYFSVGEPELVAVATDPGKQRKGLAFSLLSRTLPIFSGKRVTLEARRGNKAALALYKKAGFKITGVRKGLYSRPPEDGIVMERAEG